ncbi:hypothetical protein XBKQ1_2190001 [Xenorhabdus bovienii str. kraussei Quebec]|uniref:Uncharacterized protein n=1 Tax=Xenorhabdus bovienii str. kraussei Quebec TaxID=1398203 RepID=A0A077PED7_XENBV|nr:hypothetical protein XBKQ1_2190001 [Xenorhabdus bovienii str. kraussei Quebec]
MEAVSQFIVLSTITKVQIISLINLNHIQYMNASRLQDTSY